MVMELKSGRNNNEAEVCLLTEQSRRGSPCRGNWIFKGRPFGKRRMAPPRNWKKAHEAEEHSGEADGGRPCENVGLYKSNR